MNQNGLDIPGICHYGSGVLLDAPTTNDIVVIGPTADNPQFPAHLDSGGPLYVQNGEQFVVIGVLSGIDPTETNQCQTNRFTRIDMQSKYTTEIVGYVNDASS